MNHSSNAMWTVFGGLFALVILAGIMVCRKSTCNLTFNIRKDRCMPHDKSLIQYLKTVTLAKQGEQILLMSEVRDILGVRCNANGDILMDVVITQDMPNKEVRIRIVSPDGLMFASELEYWFVGTAVCPKTGYAYSVFEILEDED